MMFDDPRRAAELRPARVRLLHANLEAEEPQLFDDVGAGPRVGGRADRPAADGAGEHPDVSAGVLVGENARVARAAGGAKSQKNQNQVGGSRH